MHCRICLALGLLLFQLLAGTSFAVTREEVKAAVETRYKVTKIGFLGNVDEQGSVLIVQKEGLKAGRPSKAFKPNVIVKGQITSTGGGDVPLGSNVDGNLKTGDRLYLYGVRTGDGYVELTLFTAKTFVVTGSGTRGPIPLEASVRFLYDGGLAAVTAQQVIEDIGAWFGTEGESKGKVEEKQKETVTRTVHLGQTPEEVTAILGAPEKKILLGSKIVFVYKDIKLVFIDGKLADVQ